MNVVAIAVRAMLHAVSPKQRCFESRRATCGGLRAIEHWDSDDWLKAVPERNEIHTFVARRKRSTEILSQLLTLIPRLEIKGQECLWIVRKSSTRKKQKTRGTDFRL
jgi:hypothetical protein